MPTNRILPTVTDPEKRKLIDTLHTAAVRDDQRRQATIAWITEAATAHDVYPFALPPIGPDVDLRLIISIAGEIVGAAVAEISKNMPKRRIAGPHECWPRSTDRPGYEWMGARKDWNQGHCIYDGDDDGETCIFCGEPEERK